MSKKGFTLVTPESLLKKYNSPSIALAGQSSNMNHGHFNSVLDRLAATCRRPTSVGSYAYYARPYECRYLEDCLWFDGFKDFICIERSLAPVIKVEDSFTWSIWAFLRSYSPHIIGFKHPLQYISLFSNGFYYVSGRHTGSIKHCLPTLQWLHLCIVKNKDLITYYVDGVDVGHNFTDANIAGQPLYLGGYPDKEYSPCILNDVRIYKYAISKIDILSLSRGMS